METLTLNTSITIDVPASKVWQGLTDPAIVKQYFFGTNLKSDWKVGSPITFEGEWEGQAYTDKGTILKIIPGKYVLYNYWSSMSGTADTPDNYAEICYDLSGSNSQTILKVTQDRIKTTEALEHSEKMWQMIFGKMKELLEAK